MYFTFGSPPCYLMCMEICRIEYRCILMIFFDYFVIIYYFVVFVLI